MPPSPQQTAVYDAVEALDHPSADEVFMHVRTQMPRVSLGTVYRNLDTLVREGRLRIRHVGGTKRYDNHLDPHAHLHCTACDRLIDIDYEAGHLRHLVAEADRHGFHVDAPTLELTGTCADCSASTVSSTFPPTPR